MAINLNKLMFRVGQINQKTKTLITKICKYANTSENEELKKILIEITENLEVIENEVSYELIEETDDLKEEECLLPKERNLSQIGVLNVMR